MESQNGWPTLTEDEVKMWTVPGTSIVLPLQNGVAGMILCYIALWYHERVEPLTEVNDDGGWSPRFISGTDVPSNHWSATAADFNWDRHPYGIPPERTLTKQQIRRCRWKVSTLLGVIRWGGDYTTPDTMHWEINSTRKAARALAAVLRLTPRGRRVLALNRPNADARR